ncbi:MAG: tRNA (adenosine(37)-N6)-dimethylallyltransferase MiaA [Clostridia bacterium]|nr:tRNA (adenosine(37)-N6)-dimethylallyltransferase MiaA [Clostridia bacterium]
MKDRFATVVGATASGKSALALYLAKRFGGEIVSCDSMQIYRGMDIGTAKPAAEEMREVPHHMIDILSPDEDFSAGDFAVRAKGVIKDVLSRGKLPIVCGGTFLYLDSLTEVSSLSDSSKDGELRRRLEDFAKEHGAASLHEKLEAIDPASALAIHENNVKRVIRAIEIYETTGIPKSEWDRRSKEEEAELSVFRLMIAYHDRELLYRRIDKRVDRMMEQGLLDEARVLYDAGYLAPETVASQAIGYKEFIGYFEGKESLAEAVERIKQSTKNYAKRQLTWLKRYSGAAVVWGDDDAGAPREFSEICSDAGKIFLDAGFAGGGT